MEFHEDDQTRWQAVLRRDPGADGLFCYGVRSTGIYCRPTCPARRPARRNVRFFATPEEAEEAGFRPCRRCTPPDISTQQSLISRAQHILATAENPPSLAELGRALGISPFHLQRLFKRQTGMSPKEYSHLQRTERLKASLKAGSSVTDALYEAGFGSTRALYEQADRMLGMTPGAYRRGGAGQTIAYALADSPLGRVLVAATERGVCAVRFGEDADLLSQLRTEFPGASLFEDTAAVEGYVSAIREHLGGQRIALDLPLDVRPTQFQERVWEALRAIPYGETRSYKEVARMIGEPDAVRAVARACAANPVALAVPCHRVVKANGDPGGYRWGVDRKKALIEGEKSAREHEP